MKVLGIVNVTPDSFSDGGRFFDPEAAVAHALQLLDEGADAVDVGGESTRPGAAAVDEATELRRVVPVIEAIVAARPEAIVSIDTSKATVAAAALQAGARIVNDVAGLRGPGMLEASRAADAVIVMHMRGEPRTMQADTAYDDLIGDVLTFLAQRVEVARNAGIAEVIVDPGVGFGKAAGDNPALIRAVPRFRELGPVLVGASRKSFIGRLTGVTDASDRLAGSLGAACAAARYGADWLRVHDVAATRQALAVFEAC